MLKNTHEAYGSVSKSLHWLMAILIISLLIIGYFLADLKEPLLYKTHKAVGFLVLMLTLIRLTWRFINPTPSLDKSLPKIITLAAHIGHYTLYLLMIIIPLSAFISSNASLRPVSFLFLFDMPLLFAEKNTELANLMMEIHSVLALVLIITIAMHILAALYHHFIRKDNVLIRMLPSFFKAIRMKH